MLPWKLSGLIAVNWRKKLTVLHTALFQVCMLVVNHIDVTGGLKWSL